MERKSHYSNEERVKILRDSLVPYAGELSIIFDDFTFWNYDRLIDALKIISKRVKIKL